MRSATAVALFSFALFSCLPANAVEWPTSEVLTLPQQKTLQSLLLKAYKGLTADEAPYETVLLGSLGSGDRLSPGIGLIANALPGGFIDRVSEALKTEPNGSPKLKELLGQLHTARDKAYKNFTVLARERSRALSEAFLDGRLSKADLLKEANDFAGVCVPIDACQANIDALAVDAIQRALDKGRDSAARSIAAQLVGRADQGGKVLEAPIPSSDRTVMSFFKQTDGERYIVVDVPKEDPSLKKMHFYIGSPGRMRRLDIIMADMFRDGGTIEVYTDEGILYAPPCPKPEFIDKDFRTPLVRKGGRQDAIVWTNWRNGESRYRCLDTARVDRVRVYERPLEITQRLEKLKEIKKLKDGKGF